MIKRYPSIAALADDAESHGRYAGIHGGMSLSDCAGELPKDSLLYARQGNTALVPEAEKLIDKLSAEIEVATLRWQPDICGAYPIVPEYLAGVPECMRRRQSVESERVPLNIYVCPTCSHGVTAYEMQARGTAILALVLAMARIRPITLSIVAIGDGRDGDSVLYAPINTTPLDIATSAYVLTSAGFFRRLCLGLQGDLHGTTGNWPKVWVKDKVQYGRDLIARLGGDPETDLWVDGALWTDPLVRNPVAWLKDQIARCTGETE